MDIGTLNILMGVTQLGNSAANAFADISQGNFIAQQFKFNSQIAEVQQQEAQLQGVQEQQVSQERTAQLSGSQKAAEASQGVDVATGTPAITREQTAEIGGLDYLTIGNNAFLKGLGFKISATNDTTSAGMVTASAGHSAAESLLGGGQVLFQDTMKGINYESVPSGSGIFSTPTGGSGSTIGDSR